MELDLPGFRFHPTEEELLDFYLKHMVRGKKLQFEIITTINLYRYNPWELPGLAKIGEREWYFYVPRDRRQANGGRPSRTTERGFWKATGSDRPVRSAADPKRLIGLKKTLVYYEGRAPRGAKTDWVMNEYRLPDPPQSSAVNSPPKEDIVLCKIYRKATSMKELEQRAAAMEETTGTTTVSPNSESVADSLLELEADPEGFQLDCANLTFDDVMFVEGRKEEEEVVVAVAEDEEEEEKEEVDVEGVSTWRPSLRMLRMLELEADPEGFQLDCADLTFDDVMFVEGMKEEEMVVVAVAEDEKEEEKKEIDVGGVSTRRPSLSELVVPRRNGLEWLPEPLLSQLRSPWMVADIWSPYYYSSSILNF